MKQLRIEIKVESKGNLREREGANDIKRSIMRGKQKKREFGRQNSNVQEVW